MIPSHRLFHRGGHVFVAERLMGLLKDSNAIRAAADGSD